MDVHLTGNEAPYSITQSHPCAGNTREQPTIAFREDWQKFGQHAHRYQRLTFRRDARSRRVPFSRKPCTRGCVVSLTSEVQVVGVTETPSLECCRTGAIPPQLSSLARDALV